MSQNLELRSTFQFSGEGLGTLAQPQETRITSSTKDLLDNESIKKNNFGVATLMSRVIMNALDQEMLKMNESYASKKLASIINRGFDDNQVALKLRSSKKELENFEFNSEHEFEKGVSSKFFLKQGAHKGHIILHVPAFIPEKELDIPKEATNFKISARLISISDFERSGEKVSISNKVQHGKFGVYETTMLPVLRIPTQPLTAQLSIPGSSSIHNDISAVLVLGIKFYTYRNSKFSFMSDHGMMKIITVR